MTLDLGIIRRQRYVSNVTAANITTSTYAQGGTITSYTYSGTTYIAHIFTVSGIFTVTSDIYPLEFIAVAGGGGGGNNAGTNAGGGGGGGGVKKRLGELITHRFAEAREKRHSWAANPVRLEEVRRMGAERARKTARIVLDRARNACGLG